VPEHHQSPPTWAQPLLVLLLIPAWGLLANLQLMSLVLRARTRHSKGHPTHQDQTRGFFEAA
jgi:hypothetical protein